MSVRATILAGLFAGLVLALLALQTPILRGVRGHVWEWWVGATGTVFRIGTLRVTPDVSDQLKGLQAENVRLRAELVDWRRLRDQIASPGRDELREIPAAVHPVPFNLFRSQYVINRGARDGIIVGAPVVVYGSVLVGFISELSDQTAMVRLVYHPEVTVPVEIHAGEEGGQGLAQGIAHTGIEVATIPQDVPVAVGQAVITIAEPPLLPAGLVVGHVAAIQRESHEPYQRAQLALPFNPAVLRAVTVLVLP